VEDSSMFLHEVLKRINSIEIHLTVEAPQILFIPLPDQKVQQDEYIHKNKGLLQSSSQKNKVSAEKRGVNYRGIWTAEVSGFSESFLSFIAGYEGLANLFEE
jgi:hypothetical protein